MKKSFVASYGLLLILAILFLPPAFAQNPPQLTLSSEQIVSIEVGSRGHGCVFLPPGGKGIEDAQFWFPKFGVDVTYVDEENTKKTIRLAQHSFKARARSLARKMNTAWQMADEQGKKLQLDIRHRTLLMVEE